MRKRVVGYGIALGLVSILGIGCIIYNRYIIRRAEILGVDVSYMKIDDAINKVENTLKNEYRLTIHTIDNSDIILSGEQLNLEIHIDNDRDKWRGFKDLKDIDIDIKYDKGILDKIIKGLEGDKDSEDARLSDSMEIIAEKQGNKIETDKTRDSIDRVIMELGNELDLKDAGCYKEPKLTASMISDGIESLKNDNMYSVNYIINNTEYKYNWEYMKECIEIDDNREVVIDYDKSMDKFIDKLNKDLTTLGNGIEFRTSKGDIVQVPGGNWGWWLDKKRVKGDLGEKVKALRSSNSSETLEGELYWIQEGAKRDTDNLQKEILENYVEIDLTNQRLYLYRSGSLIGDWGIVSGTYSDKSRRTPSGIYKLTYKERNATLTGDDYSTPVKYWMPFNGGIGIHDASWRTKFGGSIYKRNGSHGCINMPEDGARILYDTIDSRYAIICYYR